MAAAELKHDNVPCDETAKSNASTAVTHREIECYRFKALDLLFYILSASIFLADVATDSIVFMEYLLQGHLAWGCFAMSFTILPACIVHLFSLRWYYSDGSLGRIDWLLHFLFLGILHRYMYLLYIALQSLISKQFTKDKNWVYRQQSDICMLHLFESFMGAAPQLILQLYVMAVLHQAPLWTSLSAIVSCCSLTWAVGTYTKAMHKVNSDCKASWIALTLQALWRGGMLTSRIAVLVLTAVCIRKWFLLFFGIHWLFMTIWIILQNTDFCPTIWEERIYNCIIGLIYCFDFFNLHVGKSRYRVFIFYLIIVVQNLIFLIAYALYFKDTTKTDTVILIIAAIIGGMIIGLANMLFYYGKFHPSKIAGHSQSEIKSENNINKTETPRSFKQYYRGSLASLPHSIDISQRTVSQEVTTDKQFLLTNIIQVPDCIEEGVVNQMCNAENEFVNAVCIVSERETQHSDTSKEENNLTTQNSSDTLSKNPLVNSAIIHNVSGPNTSDSNSVYFDITADYDENSDMETIHRQKRHGICLPVVQDLDIDKDVEDSAACLPSQKRRGICSSTQFIFEIENDLNEKIASNDSEWQTIVTDSLDNDTKFDNKSDTLESSLSKVYNNLNSIKNREKLRTPIIFDTGKLSGVERLSKDFQQRDETMSCVTSIHDYENVCPLGVARPPWCIRSWKGYTDIETYIHDDSIVRDRRRDTLTSTTTGTTYSSDFSDTTCASSLIKGILKQEDYLDTLVYDLIDPYDLKSAYTDELSTKIPANIDEQNTTLYIAKPVVIDDKGGMFALDTILEEHDDVPADNFKYDEPACNSVSTLVSTIDQIRKYTAENSPRHVYHTTETQWEDLDPKTVVKGTQFTKALFKSDLQDGSMLNNTQNSRYINSMNDASSIIKGECEVDAIRELMKCCRIQSIKKTPLIDAILSDSPILGSRTKLQKHVTIAYCRNEVDNSENDLYVEMSPLVPVKDIDSISINVSGTETFNNVNASSVESKSTSTSPDVMPRLSNLYPFNVQKPGAPCDKRKKAMSYSKRKFSLLKERFEPKSQLVYVVTPDNAITLSQSTLSSNSDVIEKKVSVFVKKKTDTSMTYDKENLVPDASSKIAQSHNIVSEKETNAEVVDQNNENDKSLRNVDINLSERRHIFLEQVLSPPKLLNWNKKKLSNSCTKKL